MIRLLSSIFIYLLFISAANANVIRTDIESELNIAPNETKTIVIKSKYGKPVELFWQTLGSETCKSSACIKFKEKDSGVDFASFNGQGTYEPTNNKVTLSFTNQAKIPVILQITRIQRTCTAEICSLIHTTDTQDWKVLRIEKLKNIQHSKDGSYSTLQGVTTKGKEFEIILAWWFYQASSYSMSCPKFIKHWIDKPNSDYVPYVIAGSTLVPNIKNKKRFILSVDTCTKKAANFNAPEESEY